MALDDDQPLSGAQFARQVGTDPERWAREFLKAAAVQLSTEGNERRMFSEITAEREAFVASWFRDAMEAAVKAAGRQEWPPEPAETP